MRGQLAHKGGTGGIAIVGVLGEGFSQRFFNSRWQVAACVLDSQRIRGDDLKHHCVRAVAGKRQPACEHLKGDNRQRELIRAAIDLFGPNLLRRHVSRRSETHASSGQAARVILNHFCKPEISNLNAAVLAHQNIGGLDVTVYDAGTGRIVERFRDLAQHIEGA